MNRFFLKFFFILSLIMIQNALLSQNYTTKKTAVGKSKKLYDEGVKHNILGETQKALDAFSDALKSEPTFIDAQIQQAAAFYKLGKFNDAETAFEKVEKIDPNYEPEVLFSLGNIE